MGLFAPVCPPKILYDFKRRGILGNYHLLLAHDVAENPQAYRDLFGPTNSSNAQFIIMDNSLIELGKPVPLEVMEKACETVRPDCIVLPDKLGDKDRTIEMSQAAAPDWCDLPWGEQHLMGVPQGQDLDELLECAEALVKLPNVRFFGLPRFFTMTTGTRRNAIEVLTDAFPAIPIHLLGFSDDVKDDVKCAQHRNVIGIDSAAPIRAGYHNISFTQMYYGVDIPPRGEFWKERRYPFPRVIENLELVRRAVGDHGATIFAQ